MPPRQPDAKCNGRTRRNTYCQQRAGCRTNHEGTGRCWLHGGNAGRPNSYGIRKNGRSTTELARKTAYYLEGDGAKELRNLNLQLARFNGLWDYLTQSEDKIEAVAVKDLVKLVAETSRALQRDLQLQHEGALKLETWKAYAAKAEELFAKSAEDYIREHFSVKKADARADADTILGDFRRRWKDWAASQQKR